MPFSLPSTSPATRPSSSPTSSPLAASAYPRKKKGSLWTPSPRKAKSSTATDLSIEQHDASLPDLGSFPSLFAFFQAELAALSSSPSLSLPTSVTPFKAHRHLLRDSTSRQNILALGSGCAASSPTSTVHQELKRERSGRRKRQRPSRKDVAVEKEEERALQVDWNVLASEPITKEDVVLSDTPTFVIPEDDHSPLIHPASPSKPQLSPLYQHLASLSFPSPPRSPSPPLPSTLRRLAVKLIHSFPHDELSIATQVLAEEILAETGDYNDPSTSVLYPLAPLDLYQPMNPENGVHIFIDHSNILVGLLSHLAQHSSPTTQRRTLSTIPNLSLLLQRGRPLLAPPSLVASSPLWQNLSAEKERGWDVCVLKRVRVDLEGEALALGEGVLSTTSGGSGSSEDSDEGGLGGGLFASEKYKGRVRNHAGAMRGIGSASKGRKTQYTRKAGTMKEQGVDELLQLKILQTLLSHLPSTLVLATGDAAGSSLNATGFLGCVRQALSLGWDVEVWGWKSGMSGGWRTLERERRGAHIQGEGRFWIGELDPLAEELEGEDGW